MLLSDFKKKLDDFIEQECSVTSDGQILMRSHGYQVHVDFYDNEGEPLPEPKFVHSQFSCGCVSGLDLHLTTRPDNEVY